MQFANINGVTLHYQVISAAENKPTLVFANSLATDFRIWRDCIVRLVGECSLIMYDKRGHGLSDTGTTPYKIDDHVNDLAGLLDHLGISNAVICGLSVGGMIAQGLNFLRPDLVRAMILCGTAAKIGNEERWNENIAAVEKGGIEAIADDVLSRWFTKDFHENRPDDLTGYRTMICRSDQAGYLATCAALRDGDLRGAAPQTKVPSICIVGDQDGSTPPTMVLELAKNIPDARFEVIKGAGHLPCVEKPEILVEIIKAFLIDAEIVPSA